MSPELKFSETFTVYHALPSGISLIAKTDGAIGGGLHGEKRGQAEIEAAMRERSIDVGAIFYQEFQAQLEASGAFEVANRGEEYDATIALEIDAYGLMIGLTFAPPLYPILSVKATMTSRDGRVIWRQSAGVRPNTGKNKTGYRIDEYIADPERLREVFQNALRLAAQSLVEKLPAK
ncbi:hypothetical protein [Candidatus Thiodictyon syntrophicum]|uniref:hypothetical protein n=1 Tax=Candidatus Thiodictyon syntrophicum TaxID=1166950 RepID=UPI0012FE4530|nr:hypothetical protein [Candidatus Thiodictyon syntrophicum]